VGPLEAAVPLKSVSGLGAFFARFAAQSAAFFGGAARRAVLGAVFVGGVAFAAVEFFAGIYAGSTTFTSNRYRKKAR